MTRHPKGSQAAVWDRGPFDYVLVEVLSPKWRDDSWTVARVRDVELGYWDIADVTELTPLGSTARLLLEEVERG